jgi:DNA-binding YbaB/EbfC family protein
MAFSPRERRAEGSSQLSKEKIKEESSMKFPGGFDIQEMMKQAQQMQEDMQRELQQTRVEASAGGGMVRISMNGAKELLDIKIDPEAAKGGDVEMLQDLITAAFNEATRKADEAVKGKLGSKLGGMGLPDGLL